MDELALKFLVIGFALVFAFLFLLGATLYLWQRHRRMRVYIEKEKIAVVNGCIECPGHIYNTSLIAGNDGEKPIEPKRSFAQIFHGTPPRLSTVDMPPALASATYIPSEHRPIYEELSPSYRRVYEDEEMLPISTTEQLTNNPNVSDLGVASSYGGNNCILRSEEIPGIGIYLAESETPCVLCACAELTKAAMTTGVPPMDGGALLENNQPRINSEESLQMQDDIKSVVPKTEEKKAEAGTNMAMAESLIASIGPSHSNDDDVKYTQLDRTHPNQQTQSTSCMREQGTNDERNLLRSEFEELDKGWKFTTRSQSTVGGLGENLGKNRFYEYLPYDFNRVKLKGSPADYINASFIKVDETYKRYIASQGPIDAREALGGRRIATVNDFWRAVWDEGVNCIVMLTQCVEKNKVKCGHYWPEHAEERMEIGNTGLSIMVHCVTEDELCYQREIWIEKTGAKSGGRKVVHWQIKEWQDDYMEPSDIASLLTFIESVRASEKRYPLLVHCSAGIGRTGVYIALDILLDKMANSASINVRETVEMLRAQRPFMIQTPEQYVNIFEAIALAIRRSSPHNVS